MSRAVPTSASIWVRWGWLRRGHAQAAGTAAAGAHGGQLQFRSTLRVGCVAVSCACVLKMFKHPCTSWTNLELRWRQRGRWGWRRLLLPLAAQAPLCGQRQLGSKTGARDLLLVRERARACKCMRACKRVRGCTCMHAAGTHLSTSPSLWELRCCSSIRPARSCRRGVRVLDIQRGLAAGAAVAAAAAPAASGACGCAASILSANVSAQGDDDDLNAAAVDHRLAHHACPLWPYAP